MEPHLIKISNLTCKYKSGRDVLHVANFHLDRGELVFLLGPSGIGKSTLVEAIGLINNTAKMSDNSVLDYYDEHKVTHSLIEIWERKYTELENFRKEHFSFIFQNNYLMPNLTAGENMMLTLLMKGDTEAVAMDKIKFYMNVVNLSDEVINKQIYFLSGGQKQRLAFVRAIASPFNVLIADEPTGNLDSITASRLMEFTRKSIVKHKKSGLFVSHDINLALYYADRIYIFKPEKKGNEIMGYIDEHLSIYRSENNWYNNNGLMNDPYQTILNTYQELR